MESGLAKYLWDNFAFSKAAGLIAVTSLKIKFSPGTSMQVNPVRILRVFRTHVLRKTFQLMPLKKLFEKIRENMRI